jgi:acyl dehydratase
MHTLLEFGPQRIEKADMLAFAAAFDPQPAHLDEDAARGTPLRGLAASGWHTCIVVADALEEAMAKVPGYIGMVGVDQVRWLTPVRPGDALFGQIKLGPPAPCLCASPVEQRPACVEARNGCGRTVVRWFCHALFRRDREIRPELGSAECTLRRARPARVQRRPDNHLIKYFEDVRCGDEIALGSFMFDSRCVGIFDGIVPRPAGQSSRAAPCGRPQVRGWNVVAGWMRLIVAYYDRRAKQLAGEGRPVPRLGPATGVRWLRWLAPVSIGERVSFRSWVEHKVNAAGAGQWGLLVAGGEGYNEAGRLVVSFYPQFLLERRGTSWTG